MSFIVFLRLNGIAYKTIMWSYVLVAFFAISALANEDENPPPDTVESMGGSSGINGVFDDDLDDQTPLPGCPGSPVASAQTMQGPPGRDGVPGANGNPGTHGIPGLPGLKGNKGDCDCAEDLKRIIESDEFFRPNIHQCAWNKLSYAMRAAKIQTCTFSKKRSYTSLRVGWYGTQRVVCDMGEPCCNRWYFTFNGGECANPLTIDALIYVDDHNATVNIHRSTAVVGICNNLPSGLIDVAFWSGPCDGNHTMGDSRTGWNTASRIIIEEIPIL